MQKFLLYFLFTFPVAAQFSSTASHIRFGSSLPATCSPTTGDVFFKTTATISTYECRTTNNWTQIGSGAAGGVTTLAGTANQITASAATGAVTLSLATGIDATKIGGGAVSSTEFGYLDGVTSAIQAQMDLKAPLASPTFTGRVSVGASITGGAPSGSVGLSNFYSTGDWISAQQSDPVAAPSGALAGAGAGNIDNGSHEYAVTFVSAPSPTRQTSRGPAVTVTVTDKTVNGKVSLTAIPTGPTGTVARNVYRSTAGKTLTTGSGLLTTIADNTTTVYTDNTADSGLGATQLGGGTDNHNMTAGTIFADDGTPLFGCNGNECFINTPYGFNLYAPNYTGFGTVGGGVASHSDTNGGIIFTGSLDSSEGGIYGPISFQSTFSDTSHPATNPYFSFQASAQGYAANSPADGSRIMMICNDFAAAAGFPCISIVSGFTGTNSGGFPNGGMRFGVNDNDPTAIFSVVNPTNAEGPSNAGKVAASITAASGQTANMLQTLASDGATVTSKVDSSLRSTYPLYGTMTNCSSAASPAVCASAAAGSVAIPTGVTSVALTINTTAVTANSQILLFSDDTLGAKLSVTCNSTLATLVGGLAVTARTAGTSFQITYNGTIATNPLCVSYMIVN